MKIQLKSSVQVYRGRSVIPTSRVGTKEKIHVTGQNQVGWSLKLNSFELYHLFIETSYGFSLSI